MDVKEIICFKFLHNSERRKVEMKIKFIKQLSFQRFFSLLMVCFALSILFFSFVEATDRAQEILEKADSFFADEMKFTFRIEDYEDGENVRYYLFDGYTKGVEKYLIVAYEPAVMKGVVHMRIGDTIYNYLRKIDRLQQRSARDSFENSILTQEDVLNAQLENFYYVEGYEKIEEKGQKLYVLDLRAKSQEVAYNRIKSYIDTETYFPVRQEYFSFAGDLIKELVVEEFEVEEGKLALYEFTMYDTLREGYYSRVTMKDFDYQKDIPDTYFTRSFMRRIAR